MARFTGTVVSSQSSVSLRANDGTSRSIASSIEEINVKRTAITLNALSGNTYIDPLITGICYGRIVRTPKLIRT